MLILTARIGESIVIDNGTLTVKLLELRSNQAKLAFSAPENIIIDREKVHKAKVQEAIETKLLQQKTLLKKRGM